MGGIVDDLKGEAGRALGYTAGSQKQVKDKVAPTLKAAGLDMDLDPAADEKLTTKAGPVGPDLTDELIQKARTNMAMRLGYARGRSSTFSQQDGAQMDLAAPVLGAETDQGQMATQAVKWRRTRALAGPAPSTPYGK